MALPQATYFRGPQNTVDSTLAGGTALTALVIRPFPDFQKIFSPTETPFSSSVGKGPTVNQKKVEWGSSFLAPNQVTLGAAVADGTTTSITLAAGEGAKLMVTDLIQLELEIMWVRGIATDVITVTRGMSGTTAVAHTLNDTAGAARILEVLSPAAQENADTPIAPVAKGALEWNYPQLMDYAIQVSNRENVTPDYEFNKGTKYEQILSKRMKEAAIQFEKLMIRGRRGTESSAIVGTGTPTTMGGLEFFTDQVFDLSGAPLGEVNFLDMVQRSWDRVGSDNTPDTIFVGPFVKRAISSLWNSNRYSTVTDRKINLVWDRVETDFGPLKFMLSRYIPAGQSYLLDLDDIKKHPYKGGEWHEALLPSNGPYKKGRFTGDYTSTWRGNQKRQRLINISVNPADYPNM